LLSTLRHTRIRNLWN